jgi:hypothetical protein
VEIELVPDPGAHDPAAQAAAAALAQEGIVDDMLPAAYQGAWRRSGLLDAVEKSPSPDDYAPPARSSVGAARA